MRFRTLLTMGNREEYAPQDPPNHGVYPPSYTLGIPALIHPGYIPTVVHTLGYIPTVVHTLRGHIPALTHPEGAYTRSHPPWSVYRGLPTIPTGVYTGYPPYPRVYIRGYPPYPRVYMHTCHTHGCICTPVIPGCVTRRYTYPGV